MPLMNQLLPAGERDDGVELSSQDQHTSQDAGTPLKNTENYDDFEELGDEYVDSDMEGSILNRPRPKKLHAPSLPNKNNKRASLILETLTLELKNLDGGGTETKESDQDPHELYLSSEEDASESADDEDSLLSYYEEDENLPSSRSSSRTSQEDTARTVSIRFVGKPQVVEINTNHQQKRQLPEPRDSSDLPSMRPAVPPRYPSSNYRLSISSTSSSLLSSASGSQLPTQRSSKMANLTNFVNKHAHSTSYIPDSSPSFLASDPCPTPDDTHKNPMNMWKSGRPFLQRTISAARRRPSMPKLNLSYTAGVVAPKHSSLDLSPSHMDGDKAKGHTRAPTLEELRREEKENMEQEALAARTQNGHVNYVGTMEAVFQPPQLPQIQFPMSPRSRAASMFSGLGKPKSLKGKQN